MKKLFFILNMLVLWICLTQASTAGKTSDNKDIIIGIPADNTNGRNSVINDYINAVEAAGATAIILPETDDSLRVSVLLDHIDALLLAGGEDVTPSLYNDEPHVGMGKPNRGRDRSELMLIHGAIGRGMPILGICRGMQILNVALGGTLYQDLPSAGFVIQHLQLTPKGEVQHKINIDRGSRLFNIIGKDSVWVNSFHHQAVKQPSSKVTITARSTDGVAEAMESEKMNILAVQFHPEGLIHNQETPWTGLFKDLCQRAEQYSKGKKR